MLSSRGTLSIDAVLNESIGRTRTTNTRNVVPLTEAQTVWSTASTFIKSQLLLNHPITIPKFCSFWCVPRLAVTRGGVQFLVREVKFGFSPHFITTYNLDPSSSPVEDPKLKFHKISLDLVSAECRVPADVCAEVIKEAALFIGEGTFSGKSFSIVFPELASVQIKKERTFFTPSDDLVAELFAIDSRKWPADIREAAAAIVFAAPQRPHSSASSATSAARSTLSRSSSRVGTNATASTARPYTSRRSSSSSPSHTVDKRPLFVTAMTRNKKFSDIESEPKREIRHRPRLPGAAGREALRASSCNDNNKGGAAPHHHHIDPLAPASLGRLRPSSSSACSDSNVCEEESVYDILSPSREAARRMNNEGGHAAMDNAEGEEEREYHQYQQQQQQQRLSENQYQNQRYDGQGGERENEEDELYDDGDQHYGEERSQADLLPPNNNNANIGTYSSSSSAFPLRESTATRQNAANVMTTATAKGKAVFPWESAVDEGNAAEAPSRHGGRRMVAPLTPRSNNGGLFYSNSEASPKNNFTNNNNNNNFNAAELPAGAVSGATGKRRVVDHPAIKSDSVRGLLYENTYFSK